MDYNLKYGDVTMNPEIKRLIPILTNGGRLLSKNSCRQYAGRPYDPNPHHSYTTFAEYLENDGKRAQTIKDYLKWLHKFQAPVNADTLKEWKSHVKVYGFTDKTKKIEMSNTKKRQNYLTYLAVRTYIRAIKRPDLLKLLPPTKEVDKQKSKPKHKGIDSTNWDILIDAIDITALKESTILMHRLGLRISEIRNMRKNWLQPRDKGRIIEIPASASKSTTKEKVPLDDYSHKLLTKRTKNLKDSDYVFQLNGQKLTDNDFLKVYRAIERSTKVTVSPHALRHQFAINLEKAGFTTSQIQLLLRHSDISTTGRYLTQDEDVVFDKFRRLREGA